MPIPNPPGNPPIISGTRDQQIQGYLANYISKLPGTFPSGNNYPQFAGMTYAQIYQQLATQNPNSSPYSIAVYVETLYIDAQLQRVIGGSIGATGSVTGSINQGVLKGAQQIGAETSFLNPLQSLTSSQFWVRAGEVLIGLVLIGVGLNKLAESSGLARTIVNQVPAVKALNKVMK